MVAYTNGYFSAGPNKWMWLSQAPGGQRRLGVLGFGSGPWVRIGIVAFVFVQHRQSVEAHGYIGVLGAEHLFLDRQYLLRDGNGLTVAAVAMKLKDLSRQGFGANEVAFRRSGNGAREQSENHCNRQY